MNEDRAAEGVDHLQRAAREMVAAARSFLDVVEELVEDRSALEDVAAAVSGVAGAVGEVVRRGLDGRPAPWETAAWSDPPWEHVDQGDDDRDGGEPDGENGDDTEAWAASLVDAAHPDRSDRPGDAPPPGGPPEALRPGSRVRRIVLD